VKPGNAEALGEVFVRMPILEVGQDLRRDIPPHRQRRATEKGHRKLSSIESIARLDRSRGRRW